MDSYILTEASGARCDLEMIPVYRIVCGDNCPQTTLCLKNLRAHCTRMSTKSSGQCELGIHPAGLNEPRGQSQVHRGQEDGNACLLMRKIKRRVPGGTAFLTGVSGRPSGHCGHGRAGSCGHIPPSVGGCRGRRRGLHTTHGSER